jgi:hypothetical protein
MFYKMDQAGPPKRWLDMDDFIAKGYREEHTWFRGEAFTTPVPFMELRLLPHHPDDPGMSEFLAPYMSQCGCDFFRDDLISALQELGIQNLDTYPVSITDPDNGKTYDNYKAVNIIGAISAADMKRSVYQCGDGVANVHVAFDTLVLKDSLPNGLMMFRLAEYLTTILLHESVRSSLLDRGFIHGGFDDDIEFYKLDEAAFI